MSLIKLAQQANLQHFETEFVLDTPFVPTKNFRAQQPYVIVNHLTGEILKGFGFSRLAKKLGIPQASYTKMRNGTQVFVSHYRLPTKLELMPLGSLYANCSCVRKVRKKLPFEPVLAGGKYLVMTPFRKLKRNPPEPFVLVHVKSGQIEYGYGIFQVYDKLGLTNSSYSKLRNGTHAIDHGYRLPTLKELHSLPEEYHSCAYIRIL